MQGNLLDAVFKRSSPFLILIGLLSFILLGVFVADYYTVLYSRRFGDFWGLVAGICFSVAMEGGRFGSLMVSVRDFSTNKTKEGWLGILASIVLVGHDVMVADKIAELWSGKYQGDYYSSFLFLVLFGLYVELRLVMTLHKSIPVSTGQVAPPAPASVRVSSNGAVGASAPTP